MPGGTDRTDGYPDEGDQDALRFVCIATSDFGEHVDRLLNSLSRVHPHAPVTLYTDEPQAFQRLPHDRVQLERLDAIRTLGVKRAKFDMYVHAIDRGPFVYLDADVIVLQALDDLLGEHLTGCRDDLSGCPFVADPAHPWPGNPTLVNVRYINSGVLGFGRHTATWLNELRRLAMADDFWAKHIHPDGLYDNHVLCAFLNMNDVTVDLVSEHSYNWQGFRGPRGELRATISGGKLHSDVSGEPLHLVHFAGVDDVDDYVLTLPLPIAALLNAASLQPVTPARAACAVMAGHGASLAHDADAHRGTTARVLSRAFVDAWSLRDISAGPSYVSDPDAVASVALATPSRPWHRWNGLACGGAYLEPDEYVALRDIVERSNAGTIVEFGAGETTILFASTGRQVTALESRHGPWFERATSARARVWLAPLDEHGLMPMERVSEAMTDHVDLLFVDSPNGSAARRTVLAQALRFGAPDRIVVHDARRDIASLLEVIAPFGYVVEDSVASRRGLVVLRAPNLPQAPAADPVSSVPLDDHRAALEAAGSTRAGDPVIRMTNTSRQTWPADGDMPVAASYHVLLDGTTKVFDGIRTALPCAIRPGDTLTMPVPIAPMHRFEGAEVCVTLVQEGVAWFDQVASDQAVRYRLPASCR